MLYRRHGIESIFQLALLLRRTAIGLNPEPGVLPKAATDDRDIKMAAEIRTDPFVKSSSSKVYVS